MADCLVCFEPRPAASVTLVCIPWAGAGAAPFHAWSAVLPPEVELVAVRRAGRERRLRESPTDDLGAVVAELADGLRDGYRRPLVLFGHCLGALIAFELARELRRRRYPHLRRLVVLGSPGPDRWRQPEADADLAAHLRRSGHTDESLLANSRVFDLMRPAIEADLRLGARYRYPPGEPLDVPVTVLGDGTGWAAHSRVPPVHRSLPPGDPYPGGAWPELAAVVADEAKQEAYP